MVNTGILDNHHLELIERDIIETLPESAEHAGHRKSHAMLLRRKLDGRFCQNHPAIATKPDSTLKLWAVTSKAISRINRS